MCVYNNGKRLKKNTFISGMREKFGPLSLTWFVHPGCVYVCVCLCVCECVCMCGFVVVGVLVILD